MVLLYFFVYFLFYFDAALLCLFTVRGSPTIRGEGGSGLLTRRSERVVGTPPLIRPSARGRVSMYDTWSWSVRLLRLVCIFTLCDPILFMGLFIHFCAILCRARVGPGFELERRRRAVSLFSRPFIFTLLEVDGEVDTSHIALASARDGCLTWSIYHGSLSPARGWLIWSVYRCPSLPLLEYLLWLIRNVWIYGSGG